MKTLAEYELSYQLQAGAIDAKAGTINGATVAKSGVQALGKYVMLDRTGQITRDEELAVTKIPVFTDEQTLQTLMSAADTDGGVFKIRSDHSDDLDARAGYAVNFKRDGDRVSADLKLNDSYRDRDIVLETAQKTPRLIGLSIDMIPSFEITGQGDDRRAMMRIEELLAVDIVDAGAITPDGIFLSAKVDKLPSIKSTSKLMADDKKTAPTIEECMAQLAKYAEQVTEMKAQIAKMSAPPAPDAALQASVTKMSEQMSAIAETVLDMKKTNAALGLRAAPAASPTEAELGELNKMKAAKEKEAAEKKNLTFSAVAEERFKAAAGKEKKSDIKAKLMKEQPELYHAHLVALGAARPSA